MTPDFGQSNWNENILKSMPIAALSYPLKALQRDRLHSHQYHQIAFCEQAGVKLQLGSISVEMPNNAALLVPRGVSHALAASRRCVIRCVYFKAAVPNPSVMPVFLNRLTKDLIFEISYQALSDQSRSLMSSCLYDQIGLLLWGQDRSFGSPNKRLRKVCEYFIDDPASDITLVDLARKFCISERTLRRMAKQQLGCSISKLRARCRIYEATRLLQTGVPIKHVGERVGYGSDSAFFAAFKSIVGTTPGQFQRNDAVRD